MLYRLCGQRGALSSAQVDLICRDGTGDRAESKPHPLNRVNFGQRRRLDGSEPRLDGGSSHHGGVSRGGQGRGQDRQREGLLL